ncbi:hypothetical protein JOB18_037177 [Solea senegalensis]|uniref:Uncharacterized protein n=1 Tax=Solea senegalensis TaxID=28829 RepID=A0AAV6QMU6_SOLSE|nr:hypothetical protein JOB18_037177 [Solea senegalensis]
MGLIKNLLSRSPHMRRFTCRRNHTQIVGEKLSNSSERMIRDSVTIHETFVGK